MESTATVHVISSRQRVPVMPARTSAPQDAARFATACHTCKLRDLCLPCGLQEADVARMDDAGFARRRLKRGEALYFAGEAFTSLYAVRSGFFKSNLVFEDGRDHVTGFHMTGEMMGMDGIETEKHTCDATALEDSEVCVIPYARLQQLARDIPALQQHFHRVMSREIVRDYGLMLLLGGMRAEERLATFLLNLSRRYAARGYSGTHFNLRMTREEIGSYLGLKLETVSRAFSQLQGENLIAVQGKAVEIKDLARLQQVIGDYDARRRPVHPDAAH